MVNCVRCKTVCLKKDNYCHYCGAPLKQEISKMVRDAFEHRRKKSVHDVLNVLVKEGCIIPEKLSELMDKLDAVFGTDESKQELPEAPEPEEEFINPDELEDANSEEDESEEG